LREGSDECPALGSHRQKIQQDGVWKFVPLCRNGTRHVWDPRPGGYYLDWWEGRRRKEYAGETLPQNGQPHPVIETQAEQQRAQTLLAEARELFVAHVAAHSPDKPETQRRYRQVLEHFERHVRHKRFVEAITRADIDEYKIRRCQEQSQRHNRLITARTVNFEVSTLRTLFYYLIKERGAAMENPCSRFMPGA
jgi:hypothetical protein